MTRVYLIRHCEAQGNCMRVFHGRVDSDISENGRRQLERLRERFRGVGFDAVYTSPLLRAYKTAQAADYYRGLPIVADRGLVEINGGHWEGVRFDELGGRFPEENRLWVEEPWKFAPEGGETMRKVFSRISGAVTAIVRANEGRTVVIASHGCAIRNYLCFAHGWPIERLGDVAWCDNTAVSVIDYDGKLRPVIRLENDNSHLNAETSTFGRQMWWRKPAEGGQKGGGL